MVLALAPIITGSYKFFFFNNIGTTNSGASMSIKQLAWANPLGWLINELSVIIVSHPLDYNNLTRSDAKHVWKSSPSFIYASW